MSAQESRNRGGNGEVIQAIKDHFDLVSYMELRGYTFKRIGAELYCNEMSGFCIDPVRQKFFNHKDNSQHGDLIDFVRHFDHLSAGEAISKLRKEMGGMSQSYSPVKYQGFKSSTPQTLQLPAKHPGKYSRVYAYLTKTRCISPAVVTDAVKRKMLYEDAQYHNCVFVGYKDNQPSYAAIRSTGQKKTVMDVAGSKKTGWLIDNHKAGLFVTEAPIDALSVMTLLQLGGKDYQQYSFLAQGGCAVISTLESCITANPNITSVYLCYDNDPAGRKASGAAQALLKSMGFQGKVIDKVPILNDFNDDLKAHVEASQPTQTPQIKYTQEAIPCITR